jgi:hypothetical protein
VLQIIKSCKNHGKRGPNFLSTHGFFIRFFIRKGTRENHEILSTQVLCTKQYRVLEGLGGSELDN